MVHYADRRYNQTVRPHFWRPSSVTVFETTSKVCVNKTTVLWQRMYVGFFHHRNLGFHEKSESLKQVRQLPTSQPKPAAGPKPVLQKPERPSAPEPATKAPTASTRRIYAAVAKRLPPVCDDDLIVVTAFVGSYDLLKIPPTDKSLTCYRCVTNNRQHAIPQVNFFQ